MSYLHAIPKSCAENWLDLNPTEKRVFVLYVTKIFSMINM